MGMGADAVFPDDVPGAPTSAVCMRELINRSIHSCCSAENTGVEGLFSRGGTSSPPEAMAGAGFVRVEAQAKVSMDCRCARSPIHCACVYMSTRNVA